MASSISIRVGCDLVSVDDVQRAVDRYGSRYLARVFGVNPSTGDAPPARTLAGRFAAKEAVAKALSVGDKPFPWSEVAITSDRDGRPRLELRGRMAEYAREAGVIDWDLSVTHEKNLAMAVLAMILERPGSGTAALAGGGSTIDPATQVSDATNRGEGMDELVRRVRDTVAGVIGDTVEVARLGSRDDLFAAGMTSHQTVQVMLGLEDEFDLEFPDDQLTRSTFTSLDSMARAVASLS